MKKSLSLIGAVMLASAVTSDVVASVVAATPKAPSKKSQALTIFQAKLIERKQGLYGSNKDFRAAVLQAIEAELGVSRASASTMYNSAKVEAEAIDATVGLGRDPKKVKAPSTGVRGRPKNSKNKAKVVAPVTDAVVTTEVAEPVAAEASA